LISQDCRDHATGVRTHAKRLFLGERSAADYPHVRRGKLRGQRQDQCILFGVAQLAEVGAQGSPHA